MRVPSSAGRLFGRIALAEPVVEKLFSSKSFKGTLDNGRRWRYTLDMTLYITIQKENFRATTSLV
jgi:hypothetical protein